LPGCPLVILYPNGYFFAPATPPGAGRGETKSCDMKRDSWEEARKYLEWAKRQGFSKEATLLIPNWKQFGLTRKERKIIRGLIREHFETQK